MSHESPRLRATLLVPAVVLLGGCTMPANPNQPTTPQISVSKKTVDELFRTAFVGTAQTHGCLWGKAYDTDPHTTEPEQVPNGYQPAISMVTNAVTPNNSAELVLTPRGNDNMSLTLDVTLSNGSLVFSSSESSDRVSDILATAGCKQITTVHLPV